MYNRTVAALTLGFCSVAALQGCGTINKVKGVYQGIQAFGMAKDMRDAEPVFNGADGIQVEADLIPREEGEATAISAAFEENLAWATTQTLEATDLDQEVCLIGEGCAENGVSVQFREEGRESIMEKFALGDKLKGKLYFFDQEQGSVADQAKLDVAKDYSQLFETIQSSIAVRALATRSAQLESLVQSGQMTEEERNRKVEGYVEAINDLEWIKPEYRELFVDKG